MNIYEESSNEKGHVKELVKFFLGIITCNKDFIALASLLSS